MSNRIIYQVGQRWVNDNEPELGLGVITGIEDGLVDLLFPAAGEQRRYAPQTAPLRRVRFVVGDAVQMDADPRSHTIVAVLERKGLLIYETEHGRFRELELAGTLSFNKPEERLLGGVMDAFGEFDLRSEALVWRQQIQASEARGFAGARMQLLAHQLFIAEEACSRLAPRLLLADEVGLGKTIEACLILHRLMLTGRAERVLIMVPEPLCHQWFVELLRRFHLSFALFDEERCRSIEANPEAGNPFLENQWVLAAIDFIAENPRRVSQVVAAGWDVFVIDEAHHLEGSPTQPGASWTLAQQLAAVVPSVLLLTATPLQLGVEGHFARLALLDPERYRNFAEYLEQQDHFEALADVVDALDSHEASRSQLAPWVAKYPALKNLFDAYQDGDSTAAKELAERLTDAFGVGRVMFRNTREQLGGFPKRVAQRVVLPRTDQDPWEIKFAWLGEWILRQPADEKFLVICQERQRAEWLASALSDRLGILTGLFHEGLSLLQRDRNAAYFAEPEGARVLVCSETGSEGRNFQFAQHLVLADLPDDLGLLEQRIGRLDRIGRHGDVLIHVAVVADSAEALVAQWIDEGLDGFATSISGAGEIQQRFAADIAKLIATQDRSQLPALIDETQRFYDALQQRMIRGQDRLLARRSFNRKRGERLIRRILEWEHQPQFENFVIRLFEFLGLHVEDLGDRRWFLRPDSLRAEGFPELPTEGMTVTFDRQRALEREHEGFMTMDHPMIRAALDMFLGSELGNASFAVWPAEAKRILLEAQCVIEVIAPRSLHHERFFPPTPVRIVIDHQGRDVTELIPRNHSVLRDGDPARLVKQATFRQHILPKLLQAIRDVAADHVSPLIASAADCLARECASEMERLSVLALMDSTDAADEMLRLRDHEKALSAALQQATVRLDALRLIWNGPT